MAERVWVDVKALASAARVATSAHAIYEVLEVGHRRRGAALSLDPRDVRRQLDELVTRGHLRRRDGGYLGALDEVGGRAAALAAEHGDGWTASDIAAELDVHRTTVAALVRTWDAYGVVAREGTRVGGKGAPPATWRWIGLEDALVRASDELEGQVAPVAGDELAAAADDQVVPVAGDELAEDLDVDQVVPVAGDELAAAADDQVVPVASDELVEDLDVNQVVPVADVDVDQVVPVADVDVDQVVPVADVDVDQVVPVADVNVDQVVPVADVDVDQVVPVADVDVDQVVPVADVDVDQVVPVAGDNLDPYQLHVLAALRIATERRQAAVQAAHAAWAHAERADAAKRTANLALHHARELAELAGVGGRADG